MNRREAWQFMQEVAPDIAEAVAETTRRFGRPRSLKLYHEGFEVYPNDERGNVAPEDDDGQ